MIGEIVSASTGEQYTLVKELGRGATSRVYLGECDGQRVAVKIGLSNLRGDELVRFWSELELIKALSHTGNVPTAERGTVRRVPNAPVLLLEYVPNEWRLTEQLHDASAAEQLALAAAGQYASLLVEMHNVGISSRGDRKLTDFRWHDGRLIVIDWNRAIREEGSASWPYVRQDVRLFGRLWAVLLTFNFTSETVPPLFDEQWGGLWLGWQRLIRDSLQSRANGGYHSADALQTAVQRLQTYHQSAPAKLILDAEQMRRRADTQPVSQGELLELLTYLDVVETETLNAVDRERHANLQAWAQALWNATSATIEESVAAIKEHLRRLRFEKANEGIGLAAAEIGTDSPIAERAKIVLQRLQVIHDACRHGLYDLGIHIDNSLRQLLDAMDTLDVALGEDGGITPAPLRQIEALLTRVEGELGAESGLLPLSKELAVWRALVDDSAESLLAAWRGVESDYAAKLRAAYVRLDEGLSEVMDRPIQQQQITALQTAFAELCDTIVQDGVRWPRSRADQLMRVERRVAQLDAEAQYMPVAQATAWVRDLHERLNTNDWPTTITTYLHSNDPRCQAIQATQPALYQAVHMQLMEQLLNQVQNEAAWPDELRQQAQLSTVVDAVMQSAGSQQRDLFPASQRERILQLRERMTSWQQTTTATREKLGIADGRAYEQFDALVSDPNPTIDEALVEARRQNMQIFERHLAHPAQFSVETLIALREMARTLDKFEEQVDAVGRREQQLANTVVKVEETKRLAEKRIQSQSLTTLTNQLSQFNNEHRQLIDKIAKKQTQAREQLTALPDLTPLRKQIDALEVEIGRLTASQEKLPTLAKADPAQVNSLVTGLNALNGQLDLQIQDSQEITEGLNDLDHLASGDHVGTLSRREEVLNKLAAYPKMSPHQTARYVEHQIAQNRRRQFRKHADSVVADWKSVANLSEFNPNDSERLQKETDGLHFWWYSERLSPTYLSELQAEMQRVLDLINRHPDWNERKLRKRQNQPMLQYKLWLEKVLGSLP